DGIPYLVIGYAFDGFPILAPYICEDAACTEVKEVQSSWVDANPEIDLSWERHEYAAGSGDLDRCNGMLFEDGSYAYFATDSFPYFMGCYMGEVEQSNILPGAGTGGPGQGGQPFGWQAAEAVLPMGLAGRAAVKFLLTLPPADHQAKPNAPRETTTRPGRTTGEIFETASAVSF
ncbi:MAG: YHYH protein, partial [Anaerolineae bacterium]|nr:YHYH protein [Anaerolineae bacterium]